MLDGYLMARHGVCSGGVCFFPFKFNRPIIGVMNYLSAQPSVFGIGNWPPMCEDIEALRVHDCRSIEGQLCIALSPCSENTEKYCRLLRA